METPSPMKTFYPIVQLCPILAFAYTWLKSQILEPNPICSASSITLVGCT